MLSSRPPDTIRSPSGLKVKLFTRLVWAVHFEETIVCEHDVHAESDQPGTVLSQSIPSIYLLGCDINKHNATRALYTQNIR